MAFMFTVEPFVGPLPLRFGMTPKKVATIVGVPDRVFTDPVNGRSEWRTGLSLGYDAKTGQLNEVVLSQGELYFQGVNLFAVADPIGFLRKHDSPQLAVGMIFFVNLGLRLSGLHDRDDRQRAIGLATKGHWDELADDFEPFE